DQARNGAQNFFNAQGHADDAGGTDQKLRRGAAELVCGCERGGGGGRGSPVSGAAVGVSGIDDDAAHAVTRLPYVSFRNENGSSLDAVGGEERGRRRGWFNGKKPNMQ